MSVLIIKVSVIKQKCWRGFVDVRDNMIIFFYNDMMTVLSVIKQKRGFVDVREAQPCKRGPHITLSSVYLCSSNYYQKIRRKGSLLIWSYIALCFLEWKKESLFILHGFMVWRKYFSDVKESRKVFMFWQHYFSSIKESLHSLDDQRGVSFSSFLAWQKIMHFAMFITTCIWFQITKLVFPNTEF